MSATVVSTLAPTLLLVAFPPEWAALMPRVEQAVVESVNGRPVIRGTIAGRAVVLAETGVSMVNAAMVAQSLIDRMAPARIIVSGIAGGVDPALETGAVTACAAWGQFLEIGIGRDTPTGPVLPPLPGATDLPPWGLLVPRDVLLGREGDAVREHRSFPADPALLDLVRALGDVSVGGVGVSGTGFVDNADYRAYLHRIFAARVVDMESAAVAQVAWANRVPFLALRAISDLAGGEAEANGIDGAMDAASHRVAEATCRLIAALPEGGE